MSPQPEDGDKYPATDPVLSDFVDLINRVGGTEVGVTIHASGVVISGMLVSARRYFELLTASIRASSEGQEESQTRSAEALAGYFQPWADAFREQEEKGKQRFEAGEEDEYVPPVHIHLRYAQVHSPGQEPLGQMLWRGRLTEIAGWSVGNFGHIPPADDYD